MEVAQLTAATGGETMRFEVRAGQPATLGRSSQCSVRLRDPKVSRVHCQLTFAAGRLRVSDLDSSQGLVHRGQPSKAFELDVGDGFHLGATFVRFEARGADPTLAATPPGDAPARPLAAPGPDYPDVEPERARPARRPAPAAKRFAARLTGELIVFSIVLAIAIATLVLLKKAAGFDLYALFGV
ncbi:MAG: FHA domain-containing protein [Planctomycetes bacterium]|nr:FHA domain-containing protein [Planctomycetota bacterium]